MRRGPVASWFYLLVGHLAGAPGRRAPGPRIRASRSPSREHRFEPAELQVPAGVKVWLVVRNANTTVEEFESYSLHREKVVPGGGEITVLIGPLSPGTYDFFGDFNPQTAQGRIVSQSRADADAADRVDRLP